MPVLRPVLTPDELFWHKPDKLLAYAAGKKAVFYIEAGLVLFAPFLCAKDTSAL